MPLARFEKIEPERRKRLLQAAAQEFAAQGYEGASLSRIAEGGGVSKPALYYYFEDKADLFVTVVREVSERFSPERLVAPAELDAATFWPTLEMLRDRNLAQCREEPWLVALGRLLYRPPREGAVAGAVAEVFDGARRFLKALLVRGRELGVVRTDLPEDLLILMLTAADTAADRWMVEHWEALGPEEAERIARSVFSVIRDVLSPPRSAESER